MRSFLIRALVAVVAIPALVYVFYLGGQALRVLVVLLIVLAMVEAQRLAEKAGAAFSLGPSIILALLIPWISADLLCTISWPIWIIMILLISAAPAIRATDVRRTAVGIGSQIATILWLGIGLGSLIAIRGSIDGMGFWWLILLFATLWVGDTAAYVFGVWLGEAKLSPMVSPNKTIIGAVAQMLASLGVGIVFVLAGWIAAPTSLLLGATLVVGVFGQIGDLFESLLKRAANAKDSSNLIPGHGGVLDRFDSTMFAAPSLYALMQIWPR